jgi:hypothetical protein
MKTLRVIIWVFFSTMSLTLVSQSTDSIPSIPKVFKLGEHESSYPTLYKNHSDILLAVFDNDMDLAFNRWLEVLYEMEGYSDQIGFDLKGLKLWINVFWNNDGTIAHISYYPKPNSINKDLDELDAFFTSFMNHSSLNVNAVNGFSHYGTATFPVYPKRSVIAEK